MCVDAYVCVCSEYQCFSWLTGLFHLTALTLGSPISPHTDGLQAKIQFNLQQYPDPKFQCNPDPDHVQGKLLCNISFQLPVAAESKLIVRGSFYAIITNTLTLIPSRLLYKYVTAFGNGSHKSWQSGGENE